MRGIPAARTATRIRRPSAALPPSFAGVRRYFRQQRPASGGFAIEDESAILARGRDLG